MTLTIADLHATLEHEDHLGWGYSLITDLPDSTRSRVDKAIVAVANEAKLTTDELLVWSNSKHGRWLYDRIYGNGAAATQATVRLELSRDIIDSLKAEIGGF